MKFVILAASLFAVAVGHTCQNYYSYNCACQHFTGPTRVYVFKKSARQTPNNPPNCYRGLIIDVIRSEKGPMPYMGRARINSLIDGCQNPFAHIQDGCEYRVTVYLKKFGYKTHFVVDRCNPPQLVNGYNCQQYNSYNHYYNRYYRHKK